jgi:hypothetical protein
LNRARTKIFVLVFFVLFQVKVWSTLYKVQVKYLYLSYTSEKKTFLLILKYKNLYFILVLAIWNKVFLLYPKDLLLSLKFGILFTELERSYVSTLLTFKTASWRVSFVKTHNWLLQITFFILIYMWFFGYLSFLSRNHIWRQEFIIHYLFVKTKCISKKIKLFKNISTGMTSQ